MNCLSFKIEVLPRGRELFERRKLLLIKIQGHFQSLNFAEIANMVQIAGLSIMV